jgi:hypothetical protein
VLSPVTSADRPSSSIPRDHTGRLSQGGSPADCQNITKACKSGARRHRPGSEGPRGRTSRYPHTEPTSTYHSTASKVLSRLGVHARRSAAPECADAARRRSYDARQAAQEWDFGGRSRPRRDRRALEFGRPTRTSFVSRGADRLVKGIRGEPQQRPHPCATASRRRTTKWLHGPTTDGPRRARRRDHARGREITCALAHTESTRSDGPRPLTAGAPRRAWLAQLFPIWEVRATAARARALQRAGRGLHRSRIGRDQCVRRTDDHAGSTIWPHCTEGPRRTPRSFLAHVRAGGVSAGGDQARPPRWAHSAMALACARSARGRRRAARPGRRHPDGQRVMSRGDVAAARARRPTLGPRGRAALLRAWLPRWSSSGGRPPAVARMQSDDFAHADLLRRARPLPRAQAAGGRRPDRRERLGRRARDGRARACSTCSRPASRPSPTRPPPPSSAARSTGLDVRRPRAVRVAWWRTASAACTAITHTLDEIRVARSSRLRGRGDRHRRETSTAA